jgi:hypothetical protein
LLKDLSIILMRVDHHCMCRILLDSGMPLEKEAPRRTHFTTQRDTGYTCRSPVEIEVRTILSQVPWGTKASKDRLNREHPTSTLPWREEST